MNTTWNELQKKHQDEMNAFPMHFAFGDKQIREAFEKLGLDPTKDRDKVIGIGCGGFILKKEKPTFDEMLRKHKRERKEAIAADETGMGFIYEMFLSTLNDHEYSYTQDVNETLSVLGFTAEDILNDERLKRGLEAACRAILKEE